MNCSGSLRLSKDAPYMDAGEAAAEGTRAHAWGEARLKEIFLNERIPAGLEPDNEFMDDMITRYVDTVLAHYHRLKAEDGVAPKVLIEQWVKITDDVGGTADCLVVGVNELVCADLKFGRIHVGHTNNTQVRLYALGALLSLGLLVMPEKVTLGIVQPRTGNINFETVPAKELLQWRATVEKLAARTYLPDAPTHAGEWCTFCPVAGSCETRARYLVGKYELAPLKNDNCQELVTPERIAELLPLVPQIEKWAASVKQYATDLARGGVEVPGYKLVEGRGRRVITDPEELHRRMSEDGFPEDIIAPRKLLPMTKLEAVATKAVFAAHYGDLMERKVGDPKLVPESDPGEPIVGGLVAKYDLPELD